ncbi:MAG: hypothetical protein IPO83_10085 [Chitinophagaceae bacterium]|nr:hypothetical protein [Chitinophagaceae bacterium]
MLSSFILYHLMKYFLFRRGTSATQQTKMIVDFSVVIKCLLTAGLLLISHNGHAQKTTCTYEIMRNNKTIGNVKTCIVRNSDQVKYLVETHVIVSFLIDVKVDIRLSSTYVAGELREAGMVRTVNGVPRINNHIVWQNGRYLFIDMEGDTSYSSHPIYNSISTLYFLEPNSLQKIFSENFLQSIPVKDLHNGNYLLELPDGHKNYYRYQKGICREVEMETPLSTVFLRLKSSSPQP